MKLPSGMFTSPVQVAATHRMVEAETASHYEELAEAFDLHGNPDAAETFRTLAHDAREAARQLAAEGDAAIPSGLEWPDMDDVVAEQDSLHYMMRPYHVIELAVESRRRAVDRFRSLAGNAAADARPRAEQMVEDLSRYVDTLCERLQATPKPGPGWDADLDPPNFDVE